MIKILFGFSGMIHKGGSEAVMFNIFNNIDRKKFSIDFLLTGNESEGENEDVKYLRENGAKIYYVTPRGVSFKQNKADIYKILKENKYDIVHSHMDAGGRLFLKLAKKTGVKIRVSHSHNTSHILDVKSMKDRVHKWILDYERHKLRKYGNRFVACSTEAGQWLFGKKICAGDNYLLFRNAIDVSRYEYSEAIKERKLKELGLEGCDIYGHVGRFNYQKNHEYLIKVFNEIQKENHKAKLLMVGAGELLEDVKKQIDEYNISDKVVILSNRSDVNELLQVMDYYVFPSRFEGLSVALMEAQAAGLVCIASDKISMESNVTGDMIFMSTDDEPVAWAKKILNTPKNDDQTKRRYARILVEKGFDMHENVKQLEAFYVKGM